MAILEKIFTMGMMRSYRYIKSKILNLLKIVTIADGFMKLQAIIIASIAFDL